MQAYSKNDWNKFFFLWNLWYLLNILIPYDSNMFMGHVKGLIFLLSQMVFFKVITISMWSIKNLTNNHFQMEYDKKHDVGPFFEISILNIFWLTIQTKKLMQFKTRNSLHQLWEKRVFCNWPCNSIFELHWIFATH
jgi:hypothetical protein